jgi:hypothetical protein
VESVDRNQILLTDGPYVKLGTFYDLIYQHNPSRELHFSLAWLNYPDEYYLNINALKTVDLGGALQLDITIEAGENNIRVKNFMYNVLSSTPQFSLGMQYKTTVNGRDKYQLVSEGDMVELPSGDNEVWERPVKSYRFPESFDMALEGASEPARSLEDRFHRVHYLGPLRENLNRIYLSFGEVPYSVGNRGELAIPALIASRHRPVTVEVGSIATLEAMVASWLQKLGLIHAFRLRPIAEGRREYEVLVQSTANAIEVPITDVGFGVSQVLPILILCFYADYGSTIILEQPELHLHPAVQADLADLFVEVIKTRGMQIILESHSEHLLRRLQRRMAEEQLDPDDAALYFVSMENGTSKLEELELDEYGNIHNWPHNFFGDELGEMGAMLEAAMKRKMEQQES